MLCRVAHHASRGARKIVRNHQIVNTADINPIYVFNTNLFVSLTPHSGLFTLVFVKSFTKNEMTREIDAAREALYREVGSRIREQRQRLEMTQLRLADEVRFTRASIANIELGRQKLLLHTLVDIAAALDIAPAKLIPRGQSPRAADIEELAESYAGVGHEWVKKIARRSAKEQ
jgi:transcriptional regulator with XRE-family HTH domain